MFSKLGKDVLNESKQGLRNIWIKLLKKEEEKYAPAGKLYIAFDGI